MSLHIKKVQVSKAQASKGKDISYITEERLRIILDLADAEASTSVDTSDGVKDAGLEWPLDASLAAALITVASALGVREDKSWWATGALVRFVDVGGSKRQRLVLSSEAVETNVVADLVLTAVDAEIIVADAALKDGC